LGLCHWHRRKIKRGWLLFDVGTSNKANEGSGEGLIWML